MTSKNTRAMTAKALMFVSVLVLAACDGGIFGTGGPDELASSAPDNTELSPESLSETDQNTTTNATGDVGDTDGAVATGTESDTENDAGTTAGLTAGGTATATAGLIDGGTATAGADVGSPPIDASDGSSTSATDDGITDAGTTGTVTTGGGTTGSGTADGGSADGGTTDGGNSSVSAGDEGTFINDTPTLSGPNAQLVVINTSSLTLDIVAHDTDQEAVIFGIAGVAPNTSSESTALNANVTNLTIVDSNNPMQVLISYSEFIADPFTLTTLFIREDETGINAAALATETQTSGPGLAKVRIVQGGTLGDTSLESQLRLQSAGDNPGGVEMDFGPLSFNRVQSDYKELFAGDYELIDLATRFSPVAVTLSGGSVYTLLLIGSGNDTNDVLTIIDSETP